jgi:hypothetical protein
VLAERRRGDELAGAALARRQLGTAEVALLALERIGIHCDGVYDGSFNGWSADADGPVAYGAAA